jgi:hypothetical protein
MPAPTAVADGESASQCPSSLPPVVVAGVVVVVVEADVVAVPAVGVVVGLTDSAGMDSEKAPPEQQSFPESLQHQKPLPAPGQGSTK